MDIENLRFTVSKLQLGVGVSMPEPPQLNLSKYCNDSPKKNRPGQRSANTGGHLVTKLDNMITPDTVEETIKNREQNQSLTQI